jgi:pyruvate,water dikinase
MIDDIVKLVLGGSELELRELLHGKVAHPGSVAEGAYEIGYARVVLKNNNKLEGLQEFKHGEILVTRMTDPSMENEMANALAFVTDQGGSTCHAAMIARQLRRLCIIGTDHATERIRTGDRIYITHRVLNDEIGRIRRGIVLGGEDVYRRP